MAEYDDRLSLAAYPFPEINRGDMVFATIETDPILLEKGYVVFESIDAEHCPAA